MVAATNSLHEVEKLYKAYYGRDADQDGAAYWAAKLDASGGDVTQIAGAFAHSEEAASLYGGLDDHSKVDKIYQQVFGRHADADGLEFYVGKLHSGEMTHDTIMLNVLNGARDDDLARIDDDVEEAIGNLDQSRFDSLVEHYRSTIQVERSADRHDDSGADDSPDLSGLAHLEDDLNEVEHADDLHDDDLDEVEHADDLNDDSVFEVEHAGFHSDDSYPEAQVEGMDDIALVGVTGSMPSFDI